MQSLLDMAPAAPSKGNAATRLAALRDEMSQAHLASYGGNQVAIARRQKRIREIVAGIAECRAIVGPPVYIEREANDTIRTDSRPVHDA